MGYSGSTFFTTENEQYIVKSIPRSFEHSFFRDDLLQPYATHMLAQLDSLLIRITDFLIARPPCIGGALGLVPTHHIVTENLLDSQTQANHAATDQWETWDLKPDSYFFPERDIAGGHLASDATKSKLSDRFHDKVEISLAQSSSFLAQVEADTKLLEDMNAVDYSLFLVRIPTTTLAQNPFIDPSEDSCDSSSLPVPRPTGDSLFVLPSPSTWRTGIPSSDGKYIFRAAILDFFWAKHKTRARCMTCLVKSWNLFGRHGPMSITTTPHDYRDRFLHMCRSIIEVHE